MNTQVIFMLTVATTFTLPLTAHAGSKTKAHSMTTTHAQAIMASAPMYECSICHHKANAAQAKKLHFTCPVDNGKLILIKTARLYKPH